MKHIVLFAASIAVGAAALAADPEVITQKAGKRTTAKETTLSAPASATNAQFMSILRTVVDAPGVGAAYAMSMTNAKQDVVLKVTVGDGTKTLQLVKADTQAALGDWTINAKTTEAERIQIADKIATAMSVKSTELKTSNAEGKSDRDAK